MQFALVAALALRLVLVSYAEPNMASHGVHNGIRSATGNTSVEGLFPERDLVVAQTGSKADATLSTTGRLSPDAADANFPATLLLCQMPNCGNCIGFDLGFVPHQTCITVDFTFFSVAISQPSNSGLDVAVFVGCTTLIPTVNQCFNTLSGFSTFSVVP